MTFFYDFDLCGDRFAFAKQEQRQESGNSIKKSSQDKNPDGLRVGFRKHKNIELNKKRR